MSRIDAQFQLDAIQARRSAGTVSAGIRFYQTFFRSTLASHCTMFPNDSRNAQILFRRCGPRVAIMRAMSRYYLEPDAATLGLPVMRSDNQILFQDLPQSCALFPARD